MRLSTIWMPSMAIVCLSSALSSLEVLASTNNYASHNGDSLSRSSQKPPLPPQSWDEIGFEDVSPGAGTHQPSPIKLPPVVDTSASLEQKNHAVFRLGYRLIEYQRDHKTFAVHSPLGFARPFHFIKLRDHLESTMDFKHVVFLGPTSDRQGRLLAIPLNRAALVREHFNPSGHTPRFEWAIAGVYPIRYRAPPRLELYAYASHREPDILGLIHILPASSDVQSLRYFLTRPL